MPVLIDNDVVRAALRVGALELDDGARDHPGRNDLPFGGRRGRDAYATNASTYAREPVSSVRLRDFTCAHLRCSSERARASSASSRSHVDPFQVGSTASSR